MYIPQRVRRALAGGAALVAAVAVSLGASSATAATPSDTGLAAIKHIVVIYQENHSFDNLFGGWEGVNGLARAADSGHVTQVGVDGVPLPCLPQNDVNLAALPATCHGTSAGVAVDSAFTNQPFVIDNYIQPEDSTCPAPWIFAPNGVLNGAPNSFPGGCTRDLVHRFYQEQYQIHGGAMDRYTAGSDAIGLTMGVYDTRSLPIYTYLHSKNAPRYAIADNFFQGAYGGSFLNHQWLVAAATPVYPGALADGSAADLHSVVGPDGHVRTYPLHPAPAWVKDAALTQAATADGSCAVPAGATAPPAGTVCGDYAVNTMQPWYQPYSPGTPDARRLPPQTAPTIGDRLSGAGVDWAWYAGGWDDASGNVGGPGWTNGSTPGVCGAPLVPPTAVYPYCANVLFQFHHQPFNYFANYAPGTAARAAHLRDEVEFIDAARHGTLKPVSFVKPFGSENEHPGYTGEYPGSNHLVDLIRAIEDGPNADDTMVVVTYDEFGGQWDHVSPPSVDQWGPGTRIPALVISPLLQHQFFVDHTVHDTTSILSTIEHRFGLAPLTSRDARMADLAGVLCHNEGNGCSGD